MSPEQVEIWIFAIRIFGAVLTYVLIIGVALTCRPKVVLLEAWEEIGRSLKKSKNVILNYEKLEEFLCCKGASFHLGHWVNPVNYCAIRLAFGGCGLVLGSFYGLWQSCLIALGFFRLPDFILEKLNRKDNDQMLPELELVYQAIAMQIKAGINVTDAVTECYGSVHQRRLKEALVSLSSDIVMNCDVEDALDRFEEKFDNRYIEALCITILQALESGQALEVLTDMAGQIGDMEVEAMNRKKTRLDRNITFCQLGILSAVLGVVLYACVTYMMSAASFF